MSSPFQKSFSSKTPLQIRKAASARAKRVPKKPGEEGYVKPKKISSLCVKQGVELQEVVKIEI